MQNLSFFLFARGTLLLCMLLSAAALAAQGRPVRGRPTPATTRPSSEQLINPDHVGISPSQDAQSCCLPTTRARNLESLVLEPTGTLSGEYQLSVNMSPTYANILQNYINYIGSVTPCASRFVVMWVLRNPATGQEDRQWTYVDSGGNQLLGNPYTFDIPIQINTSYTVQIYTYFEPKGCDIGRCIDNNTLIEFKLEVSPTARQAAPQLVLRSGGQEIGRIPVRNGRNGFVPTRRRN